MKKVKLFEAFITEGKWSKIMTGVKKGSKSGPWTVVVIKDGKVIDQLHVDIMDAIPASYEAAKRKHPNSKISIEDNEGMIVYNESVVNEAVAMSLDQMTDWLEDELGFRFVDTTERFNGSKGGIWLAADDKEEFKGKVVYDYYAKSPAYEMGILKTFAKELQKRGWYSEFYDPGTVMLWQK